MKRFLFAKQFIVKSWSRVPDKFYRHKVRCVTALNYALTTCQNAQSQALVYMLPTKKGIPYKPVLGPTELERTQRKLQSVIEWQKQFEVSAKLLQQLSGNISLKLNVNPPKKKVTTNNELHQNNFKRTFNCRTLTPTD